MSDKLIRVGRVSKIDYENGMISVTYPDLDDSVTSLLSVVSFNDEYKMPEVGDEVLALHLPTGQARGLVLGPYWNTEKPPAHSGKGVYYKKISEDSYALYDDAVLLYVAPEIEFSIDGGDITVSEIIEMRDVTIPDLQDRVTTLEGDVSTLQGDITSLSGRVSALGG